MKVEALRERLLSINPEAEIEALMKIYCEETADDFDLASYDYIIDAIDSLKDKVLLIRRATDTKSVFFSSMGAALKMDPTKISVAEFWKVKGCPLAAALRRKFKQSKRLPRRKIHATRKRKSPARPIAAWVCGELRAGSTRRTPFWWQREV